MSNRTVMAEIWVPPDEDAQNMIGMPRHCTPAMIVMLGDGFGQDRIDDGKRKYRLLRQMLLDEHVKKMHAS